MKNKQARAPEQRGARKGIESRSSPTAIPQSRRSHLSSVLFKSTVKKSRIDDPRKEQRFSKLGLGEIRSMGRKVPKEPLIQRSRAGLRAKKLFIDSNENVGRKGNGNM